MDNKNTDFLFEEYYNKYVTYIRKYCSFKLSEYPEDAEDCVQETFTVFAEKLNSGIRFEYAKAFLIKTASNFVKQKYREIEKQKAFVSIESDNAVLQYEQEFFEIDENIIERMKDEIISSLSENERILLYETCRNYKNSYKTTKELATKYNCSETAIRQRIFVLRCKIKNIIKDKTKDI